MNEFISTTLVVVIGGIIGATLMLVPLILYHKNKDRKDLEDYYE